MFDKTVFGDRKNNVDKEIDRAIDDAEGAVPAGGPGAGSMLQSLMLVHQCTINAMVEVMRPASPPVRAFERASTGALDELLSPPGGFGAMERAEDRARIRALDDRLSAIEASLAAICEKVGLSDSEIEADVAKRNAAALGGIFRTVPGEPNDPIDEAPEAPEHS